MDPTAPKNPNATGSQAGSGQTVIQPGQFVVAGEDAPQPIPAQETSLPSSAPAPTVSLAGERQPTAEPQVTPNSAASGIGNQPDPTPFTQPAPGQVAQDSAQGTQAAAGGPPPKKSGGPKALIIILVFALLAGIIGAVAYFFILPMIQNKADEPITDEQIIETSPIPQNPDNNSGFGNLPESTTPADTLMPPADDLNAPIEGAPVDPLTIPTQ